MTSLNPTNSVNTVNTVSTPLEGKSAQIDAFKTKISEVINKGMLKQEFWVNDAWKSLFNDIDDTVLTDASSKRELFASLFSGLGDVSLKDKKKLERVKQKIEDQKYPNYFKVFADWIAARVHCPADQIKGKLDMINSIVSHQKGAVVYIRGANDDLAYGSHIKKDGKLGDIVQYAYVFLPQIGYPVELQIGDPLASLVFATDSAIRDNPKCGRIDLWNENFYGQFKSAKLSIANGEKIDIEQTKKDLHALAKKIHVDTDGNPVAVPKELTDIIDNLES